ncbi:MAG: alanine/ornithine racemase family PLP-dependent enzyme [Parabacteroides sp.]|nr:alanine/ornithine racemase family PLP-dependent enzyme [Parabacteroides sp.]
MATIKLNRDKLKFNYDFLSEYFSKKGIEWGIVSKLLCGNELFIKELLALGHKQFCESRTSHIKLIKKLDPTVEIIYIKPPAKHDLKEVLEYSDISMNTALRTIRFISQELQKQNKTHKIIIMVELGELREGVMGEDLIEFYEQVFNLPNIEVIGLGTNLSCVNGVLPSYDKLIQLSLYKELIETKFNRKLKYISGGASVTIPLIERGLPPQVNHFRVGETLFFGTDVYHSALFKEMETDIFTLEAQIIELKEKPMTPIGEMGKNLQGKTVQFQPDEAIITSNRALLDVGLLDVDPEHIFPFDHSLKIIGSSSDMIVVDMGENTNSYKVGDFIHFKLDYMGVLRLMSSKYVTKKVV